MALGWQRGSWRGRRNYGPLELLQWSSSAREWRYAWIASISKRLDLQGQADAGRADALSKLNCALRLLHVHFANGVDARGASVCG
jgi:hypothetical protein